MKMRAAIITSQYFFHVQSSVFTLIIYRVGCIRVNKSDVNDTNLLLFLCIHLGFFVILTNKLLSYMRDNGYNRMQVKYSLSQSG